MLNNFGRRVTMVGALAQALGLGFDAWRHSADTTLAAREGLLSSTHYLLFVGIALVLIGVGMMALGPRLENATFGRQLAVPVVLVAIVGGLFGMARNSSLAEGHDEARAAHASAHGHGDGTVVPDQPLDSTTREQLAVGLAEATDVASRLPTVADAEKAGYSLLVPFVPGMGVHYARISEFDNTFDIEQPEMLLYDGARSASRIVGLSYYVNQNGNAPPAGFAGPNDHWHSHTDVCFDKRTGLISTESVTPEECIGRGGVPINALPITDKRTSANRTGWMLHVWVVPNWESPDGMFSVENQKLRWS